jgi:hypothetical protein
MCQQARVDAVAWNGCQPGRYLLSGGFHAGVSGSPDRTRAPACRCPRPQDQRGMIPHRFFPAPGAR